MALTLLSPAQTGLLEAKGCEHGLANKIIFKPILATKLLCAKIQQVKSLQAAAQNSKLKKTKEPRKII